MRQFWTIALAVFCALAFYDLATTLVVQLLFEPTATDIAEYNEETLRLMKYGR